MHRFFIEQTLKIGEVAIKNEALARQLSRVLRARSGEVIVFFNGDGFDYNARITDITHSAVKAEVIALHKNENKLSAALVVCLALARKERIEWALEKCTEIGVAEFKPIITERTLFKNLNTIRCRSIIKEATEQSGRAQMPKYNEPALLGDIMKECRRKNALGIFFDSSRAKLWSFTELSALVQPYRIGAIYLFIGPEGGFSEAEIKRAETAGMKVARIYPTVLRSETAAVAFSAVTAVICS